MKKIFVFYLYALISHQLPAQQWKVVGDTSASQYGAGMPFISVNKFNTPYIVYRDEATNPHATVKKFDGNTWIQVGPNINVGDVGTTTMDFDTLGQPVVVYYDCINNSKATVKRFDGTNWNILGNVGFTPGAASYTSIKISKDNIPYIAFRDFSSNNCASVMKFNGASWEYVGQPGFSPVLGQNVGGASNTSLAIDKNGILYVSAPQDL